VPAVLEEVTRLAGHVITADAHHTVKKHARLICGRVMPWMSVRIPSLGVQWHANGAIQVRKACESLSRQLN
jgi:hypothetical protein